MDVSANYVATSASAPAGATRKVALRLKGKPRETQEKAHLNVLLDTSDSMNDGHKLETCKKSVGFILDLMRDGDAVSLVTFDEVARTVSPLMATTAEKKTNFRTLVNSVHTDGCTNMSAGLLEAKTHLEAADCGRKQGILLLTDGHANRGVYKPDELFTIIKTMMDARPDLVVHTVGYGFDHNADLLSKIGEWTGGTYSVVKNLEDVATVFGSVLGSMVSTTAQNVRVTLPEGFKLLSQNQTETNTEGRTVIRVGDIQSEVSSVLLLEVPAETSASLTITGVDLLTHEPIAITQAILPPSDLSEEDKRNLDLAFLRLEIVNLMKEVQEGTGYGHRTHPNRDAILAKLADMTLELSVAPADLRGVVDLMKHDIEIMRNILTGNSNNIAADTSILRQHANVWTTQRGMCSATAAIPMAPEASPFVSRVASNYAGAMRQTSSQAYPPDSDDEDPSVYSAHGGRMRRQNAHVHFAGASPLAAAPTAQPPSPVLRAVSTPPGSPPRTPPRAARTSPLLTPMAPRRGGSVTPLADSQQ
jgi:Mg-chelatase subunit ChlD